MWDLGITSEIPIDLRLDTGANQALIDLSALRIRRLDFNTGASDTKIRLPAEVRRSSTSTVAWRRSSSRCPQGVAAQIRGKVVLGGTKVDETRFPQMASGIWASRDYPRRPTASTSPLTGGFGSARIV